MNSEQLDAHIRDVARQLPFLVTLDTDMGGTFTAQINLGTRGGTDDPPDRAGIDPDDPHATWWLDIDGGEHQVLSDLTTNDHPAHIAAWLTEQARCLQCPRATSSNRPGLLAGTRAPVPGETLAQAARRIREDTPITGRATDADCILRDKLCAETLRAHGATPGERIWYTAQLSDGKVAGMWNRSTAAAELHISVWHDSDCHWVVPDPGNAILDEYPRRHAISYPLDRPRTPRDRFAPTQSLIDGLTDTGPGL